MDVVVVAVAVMALVVGVLVLFLVNPPRRDGQLRVALSVVGLLVSLIGMDIAQFVVGATWFALALCPLFVVSVGSYVLYRFKNSHDMIIDRLVLGGCVAVVPQTVYLAVGVGDVSNNGDMVTVVFAVMAAASLLFGRLLVFDGPYAAWTRALTWGYLIAHGTAWFFVSVEAYDMWEHAAAAGRLALIVAFVTLASFIVLHYLAGAPVETRVLGREPVLATYATFGVSSMFVMGVYTSLGIGLRWGGAAIGASVTALVVARQAMTHFSLERERTQALASEAHYRAIVHDTSDVIVLVDQEGRIEYVSPSMEHVLGTSPDDVPETLATLLGIDDQTVFSAMESARDVPSSHLDGRSAGRPVEAVVTSRSDGFVVSIRDVSERHRLRERLHELAYADGLTGLANRERLLVRATELLETVSGDESLAALFIDLDRFKTVNDSSGHAVGDLVLREVASRLAMLCPPGGVVSRLGGDEFVILTDEPEADVHLLAADVVDLLEEPYEVDGQSFQLAASVGCAFADTGIDAEELLRRADLAMYQAKQEGSGWTQFDTSMALRVEVAVAAEQEAVQAWKDDRYYVHVQPIVRVSDQHMVGGEALLRWRNQQGEQQSPLVLLEYLQRAGLMWELTQSIVAEAANWLSHEDNADYFLTINVPPHVLAETKFGREVSAVMRDHNLAPERLHLELTEEAMVEQGDVGVQALERLNDRGFTLLVDDFGSGFSSLEYLFRLPTGGLKIDRSFVQSLEDSSSARSVVRGLVGLVKELDLELIGEGVETAAQHRWLVELGVEYAQGFYYGRPSGDWSGLTRTPEVRSQPELHLST